MRYAWRLVLWVWLAFPLAAAENETLSARVLNGQNGFISAARNLKIAVEVPPEWRNKRWRGEDFSVYIYPQSAAAENSLIEKYRAQNLLVWNLGNYVFIDARTLPAWENFGDYAAAVIINNQPENLVIPAQGAITHLPEKTDVVLLIDASFSMHKTDPKKNRRQAASAFLQMAAHDRRISRVGVVLFNENPVVVADLTPLAQSEKLQAALNRINAQGQTNIGKALLQAAGLLRDSERAAVILLTDGKNESVAYADEHRVLANKRIPVYTVGLSDLADQEMLATIAKATGGRSFWTASGADLVAIYLDIAAELGNQATILGLPILEPQTVDIPVDGTISELCFLLDDPSVNFKLFPPREISPAAIWHYAGTDFAEYRVASPEPGLWRAQIDGKNPLKFLVTARTPLFLDVFPPVATAQGWAIGATLADRGLVVDNSRVMIAAAGEKIPLFDDGEHFDGAMNDGVYAGIIPYRDARLAKLFAENAAQYRREAIIDDWNKTFALAEQIRGEIDFGEQRAGTEISTIAKVFYAGAEIQGDLRFLEMNLTPDAGGESFYALRNLKIPRHFRLQIGENSLPLKLAIDDNLPAGIYRGDLLARANGLNLTIPATLKIKDSVLNLAPKEFELGYLEPGKPQTLTAQISFDGKLPATATLVADRAILPVAMITQELTAGESEISLTIVPATDLAAGHYETDLKIKIENLLVTLPVKFQIPQLGKILASALHGHELALPAFGESLAVQLPIHELAPFFPTREKVARVYLHELHLAYVPTAAPPTGEDAFGFPSRNILWAFFFVIGGAIILLCVRRMVQNRFVRFALLSVVIHLPLLGFFAAYFFPAKTEFREPLSTMLVNLSSPENNDVAETDYLNAAQSLTEKILAKTWTGETPESRTVPMLAQAEFSVNDKYAPTNDAGKILPRTFSDAAFANETPAAPENQLLAANDLSRNSRITRLPQSLPPLFAEIDKTPILAANGKPDLTRQSEMVFQENQTIGDPQNLTIALPDTNDNKKFRHTPVDTAITRTLVSRNLDTLPKSEASLLSRQPAMVTNNSFPQNEHTVETEFIENNRRHNQDNDQKTVAISPSVIKTDNLAKETFEDSKVHAFRGEDKVQIRELLHNEVAFPEMPAKHSLLNSKYRDNLWSKIQNPENTANKNPDSYDNIPADTVIIQNVNHLQKPDNVSLTAFFDMNAEYNSKLPPANSLSATEKPLRMANTPVSTAAFAVSAIFAQKTALSPASSADRQDLFSHPKPGFAIDLPDLPANNQQKTSLLSNQNNSTRTQNYSLPTSFLAESKPQTRGVDRHFSVEKMDLLSTKEYVAPSAANKLTKFSETTWLVNQIDPSVLFDNPDNVAVLETNPLKQSDVNANFLIVKNLSNLATDTAGIFPQIENKKSDVGNFPANAKISGYVAAVKPVLTLQDSPLIKQNTAIDHKKNLPDSADNRAFVSLNDKERATLPENRANVKIIGEDQKLTGIYERDVAHSYKNSPKSTAVSGGFSGLTASNVTQKAISIPDSSIALSKKNTAETALSSANDMGSSKITISLGIIGTSSEYPAIVKTLRDNQLVPAKIALADNELSQCALILICEKTSDSYNERELESLTKYLLGGGKIWFHNCDGLPKLAMQNSSIYQMPLNERRSFLGVPAANLFSLTGLYYNDNLLAVASEGGEQKPYLLSGINYIINEHRQNQISRADSMNLYPVWQNFTNIDTENLAWKIEKWSSPATIGFASDGNDGYALHLKILNTSQSRVGLSYNAPDSRGRRINLENKNSHYVDIYNANTVPVEISLSLTNYVDPTWDEFETQKVSVLPGWNRQVKFDLTAVKSRNQASKIRGLDKCAKITYHIHNAVKNELLFDNLRWQ